MATAKQKAANRANAQHSTGPRTPEGKAVSSRNRLSHGFQSHVGLLEGEDGGELQALVADLMDEYAPATLTEQILVEKIGHHQFLTLRAISLQDQLLAAASSKLHLEVPAGLALLMRYQTTHERAFYRARTELLKAQEQRKKSEIGFERQNLSEPVADCPSPLTPTAISLVEPTPIPQPEQPPSENTRAA